MSGDEVKCMAVHVTVNGAATEEEIRRWVELGKLVGRAEGLADAAELVAAGATTDAVVQQGARTALLWAAKVLTDMGRRVGEAVAEEIRKNQSKGGRVR